ncbi:response regulator [Enterobacter sp. 22466]|uniref:response regulator n=1 Tax=Enterobacter sp. 22466 TaxID=3453924 RepID=UPI003F82D8BB
MTIKKIVIADTHPVFLIGLQSIIRNMSFQSLPFEICGQAENAPDLLKHIDETRPDIVMANLSMPDGRFSGIPFVRYFKKNYPTIRLIVIIPNDIPAMVQTLLSYGVYCVINKQGSSKDVEQCLSDLYHDIPPTIHPLNSLSPLSPKEAEVLHLLSIGHSINSIALMLSRTKQTISAQKISAMKKIGVNSDPDLYSYLRATYM